MVSRYRYNYCIYCYRAVLDELSSLESLRLYYCGDLAGEMDLAPRPDNKQTIKYLHNPALNSLAGCVTVFCTPSTAPAWCPWCRRPGGGSSCPARWPAPRPAPPPPQPAAAPGTCSATTQGYEGTGGTGVHRYNEVGAPLEQVPDTRPHKVGSLIL